LVNFQIHRLIDEALGKEVKVAVCSTSNEKAVSNPAIPSAFATDIYHIQENNFFQF